MTASLLQSGNTLRIGVTGTLKPLPAHVEQQVTELLSQIVSLTNTKSGPCRRQLLSPLAEGADRLVATCALQHGFELVCPLPFARHDYLQDFKDDASKSEFEHLLDLADGRVLELDSRRTPFNPAEHLIDDEKSRRQAEDARAYEAVGRLIVRNCDLIIGIWDGLPGKGRGGTADIIRYAANFGPPVLWVHAAKQTPARWIEEVHDLQAGAKPINAKDALPIYLERLLQEPRGDSHSGHHSMLHRIGHAVCYAWHGLLGLFSAHRAPTPTEIFLNERPRRVGSIWKLHGWLMRVTARSKAPRTAPHRPADAVSALWFDHYKPADAYAGAHAMRYRSSYVWTFLLAALALTFAVVGPLVEQWPSIKIAAAVTELVALALIMTLVLTDGLVGWQRRAIEYRLLAELCRKQQALAPLAWVVPRAGAWATAAPLPAHEHDARHQEPISWVAWLFSAWLRDAPLPTGTIDATRVQAAKEAALKDLIDDQINYHKARRTQSHRAGKTLVHLGEVVFLLVLILVIVKLWLICNGAAEHNPGWMMTLELLAGILPIWAAASVGIRAYAELEMLADQSQAMLNALCHARDQITELNPKASLASQALGSALAGVAALMLEDLEGWARLFRAKIVEA